MVSRLPVMAFGVALAALLEACSPTPTGDPLRGASQGAAVPRDVVLRQLLTQQARLWDVGYPVWSRGGELCAGRQRASFGFQAWTRWDIGGQYRIASMTVYGLDDRLRVVHVLPGSPAAEAGLHAGDVIEKIYWHQIPSGQRASAAMQQILEREARVGAPLTFHLRRDGERLAIDMAPSAHCDFDLILTGSEQINAFFDGQKIYVTDGLVRFFDDDSELAAVLGHVLGHALHGHAGDQSVPEEVVERLGALQMATMEPQDRNRLLAAGITPEARPFSPAQEIEADDVARRLLSRAGIRPEALDDAWRRLDEVTQGAVLLRDYHPATPAM
jgi:membrane-associated protease RseP (regulator of RpoE activity)